MKSVTSHAENESTSRDPLGLGSTPRRFGWFFLVLLWVFLFVPFFHTVWNSLFDLDPARPAEYGKFVGLMNYITLFSEEPNFLNSLQVTGRIMTMTLIELLVAFAAAIWLHRLWPRRVPVVVVALLVLPQLVSPTVAALMGRTFLHDQIGLFSRMLQWSGVITPDQAPLGSGASALAWVIVFEAWRWLPLCALNAEPRRRLPPGQRRHSV